jgi:integrase/recombinase XerD
VRDFAPTYNKETFLNYVKKSETISKTSKDIVNEYIMSMELGEASKNTLMYNIKIIKFVIDHIPTDLNKLTFQDINKIRGELIRWTRKDGSKVSDVTKKNYKIGIKRFLYWYARTHREDLVTYDHYTRLAERVTEGDVKKKKDSDDVPTKHVFTQEEIDKMIEVADTVRDKAIITTIAESGCRLNEIAGCRIKDFKRLTTGFQLKFPNSKTGSRTVPLLESAGRIESWLRIHPLRDDPNAPLWVKEHGQHNQIKDCTIYSLVRRIAEKAGIDRRAHPHMFRHTRATDLARENTNPEAMKQFLGWGKNSGMPSLYTHLSEDDLKDMIFKTYGIGPLEVKTNKKGERIGKCPSCGEKVPHTDPFYWNCGVALKEDIRKKDDETYT